MGCTSKQQSNADGELRVLANGGLVRLASSSFPEIVQRLHGHGDNVNWTNYYLYNSDNNNEKRRGSSNLDARGQMAAVGHAAANHVTHAKTLTLRRRKQRPASSVGVCRESTAAATIASRLTLSATEHPPARHLPSLRPFPRISSVSSSAASLRRYFASALHSSPQSARAPSHSRLLPPSKHVHLTCAHLHLITLPLNHGRRLGQRRG
jgi:hypothetical protein